MSLVTLADPYTDAIVATPTAGNGITLHEDGDFALSSDHEWFYSTDDVEVGAMVRVAPAEVRSIRRDGADVSLYLRTIAGAALIAVAFSEIPEAAGGGGGGGGSLDGYTGASNTGLGVDIPAVGTDVGFNTAFGAEASNGQIGTVVSATAVGADTLGAGGLGNRGDYSTAVGAGALNKHRDGSGNVAVGAGAGRELVNGSRNVAVGYNAMHIGAANGDDNIGVGTSALDHLSSGFNNVAVGTSALAALTTGGHNVAVGRDALSGATTASDNVAVGDSAMALATTGAENVALGVQALGSGVLTGGNNVAVGKNALGASTAGQKNVGVGTEAGSEITTGEENIFLGHHAGVGLGSFLSNYLVMGSADAPIDNIHIPSAQAVGAAFRNPLYFKERLILRMDATAPDDSLFDSRRVSFWLDEASNKLMVKVCYNDGTTFKSGEIDLT